MRSDRGKYREGKMKRIKRSEKEKKSNIYKQEQSSVPLA